MRSSEYQQLAPITENQDFDNIRKRIETEQVIRLLHAGIGLATEAGEVLDALKKHIFYGKPLDAVNVAEEVGDLFWYIALICDELGADFEDVMEKNIAKLKARYGEKFSEHRATNRDLNRERAILEYRPARIHEPDADEVVCGECLQPASGWYCMTCSKELGNGGALIRVKKPSKRGGRGAPDGEHS